MAATQIGIVREISALVTDVRTKVDAMIGERIKANAIADEYNKALAYYEIGRSLLEIRKSLDQLEEIVDDDRWPLPKYREILFIN